MIYNAFACIYSDLQLLNIKLSCCHISTTVESLRNLCLFHVPTDSITIFLQNSYKNINKTSIVVPCVSSLPGSSISNMYFGLFSSQQEALESLHIGRQISEFQQFYTEGSNSITNPRASLCHPMLQWFCLWLGLVFERLFSVFHTNTEIPLKKMPRSSITLQL